jgi:hypothetical protein
VLAFFGILLLSLHSDRACEWEWDKIKERDGGLNPISQFLVPVSIDEGIYQIKMRMKNRG